ASKIVADILLKLAKEHIEKLPTNEREEVTWQLRQEAVLWRFGDPEMRDLVERGLASVHLTTDNLFLRVLIENINMVRQFDMLIAGLETRRATLLREFDRHGAMKALSPRRPSEYMPDSKEEVPGAKRVQRKSLLDEQSK